MSRKRTKSLFSVTAKYRLAALGNVAKGRMSYTETESRKRTLDWGVCVRQTQETESDTQMKSTRIVQRAQCDREGNALEKESLR